MTLAMERPKGRCGRDLCDRLVERFAPVSPQTEITVSGDGVRWRCCAKRGQKSCLVHFLDVRAPEFLTFFEQEGKEVAAGRTPSQAETIDAVWHWLDDTPLDAMCGRFAFVDWQKRELIRIRDFVLNSYSDLRVAAPSKLVYWGSAFYHLWFRSETRSAQLYFYGKNEFPEAAFHGDQCELFRFKWDDCSALGAVLKRWLCDNALLSTMRKEFPWLNFGELPDYYESGNPVEGEFIQSWDWIERFYDSIAFPVKAVALPFIAELRRAGYDRKLRAGQSLFTFGVSRSRCHGLRAEQPYITFDFRERTMDVFSKIQEEERIPGIPIALSGRVEEVLGRLVNEPIT